jgi:putative flippase GtrA
MEQLSQQNNRSGSDGRDGTAKSGQRLLSEASFRQFVKYVITGLVSFSVEISLVYLLTDVVKMWYIYSNSIALFIVFIISFSLNRFWAFQSKQPFMKQFFMSGLLFALNLVVGNAVMFFFTEKVHLYYLFSKVIATGLSVTWNFFLYKYYIYK